MRTLRVRLLAVAVCASAVVAAAACGKSHYGGSTTPTPTPTPPAGPPVITSITPGGGVIGSTFVVAGSNFGATQGASTLTVDGNPATITSWSDASITATVPTARPG